MLYPLQQPIFRGYKPSDQTIVFFAAARRVGQDAEVQPRSPTCSYNCFFTNSCLKRVVQRDFRSWEQYSFSQTPDVWHSLQAMALCSMLVQRGIDINHGDVAWSNLEVKLQGQRASLPQEPMWPSLPQEPTFTHMSIQDAEHLVKKAL